MRLNRGLILLRPALKALGGRSFPQLSRGACPQCRKVKPWKQAKASLELGVLALFHNPFVAIGSNAVSELVRLRKHFRCSGPFPVEYPPRTGSP